jgi:hypothetical protein
MSVLYCTETHLQQCTVLCTVRSWRRRRRWLVFVDNHRLSSTKHPQFLYTYTNAPNYWKLVRICYKNTVTQSFTRPVFSLADKSITLEI